MSDSTTLERDLYEKCHMIPNPDGSITRLEESFPSVPPSVDDPSSLALSKDVQINPLNSTSVRLFLPRQAMSEPEKKLPILVFAHGGGMIVCRAATSFYHEFCSTAASDLGALVVSVDYRLAPEHRLPAAYEDTLEALTWVRDSKDEWVIKYGDLSRCVLMGDSAGGNIVYHAGLMAAARFDDLIKPLTIRGLVLVQPYFSGSIRTGSEIRLADDPVLPMNANEFCWGLSLPVGADLSHEYCDPTANGGSKSIDLVRDLGWRVGVISSEGDPLFDRAVEFVKLLESKGLVVKCLFHGKDVQHGAFVTDPTTTKEKRKESLNFLADFLA